MDYNILVIDDDVAMHYMTRDLLGDDFNLLHAKNSQQGIDILAEKPVNLILSDIHMPGVDGLQFLESLMADAERNSIPVLIMTSLPTVEKEQKALDLGAADFIDKELFNSNKEEVLERIQMKLVSNVAIPDLSKSLIKHKKQLVSKILSQAIEGDFISTVKKLAELFKFHLSLDHMSVWTISEQDTHLITWAGIKLPDTYGISQLREEPAIREMFDSREATLENHLLADETGVMRDFSGEHGLTAEIIVPLFSITDRKLLINKMEIPDHADIYGFIVLKRSKMFSTKEYKLVSKMLTQIGAILWRLYNDI